MRNCRARLRAPTNLASDALALQDKEPLPHEIFHFVSKKNREKNKFSSRVKVGTVTPKAFGVVIKTETLVPLSFRWFLFRGFLSFCWHQLFPPFSPQLRWHV